jgi:glutaredoxin
MARGLPPIELEWDPHADARSVPSPPASPAPAAPAPAAPEAVRAALHPVSAAPPVVAGPPAGAAPPAAAARASVPAAAAAAPAGALSAFVEGARCERHGLWQDAPGQCPRCRKPQTGSALWVYVAIGAVLSASIVLFVALRIRDAFVDMQKDAVKGAALAQAGRERVVVYTTSTCPACRAARSWMQANRVAYTEMNIDNDDVAASEYRKLGVNVVPAIVVDGKSPMRGFSARDVQRALQEPVRN